MEYTMLSISNRDGANATPNRKRKRENENVNSDLKIAEGLGIKEPGTKRPALSPASPNVEVKTIAPPKQTIKMAIPCSVIPVQNGNVIDGFFTEVPLNTFYKKAMPKSKYKGVLAWDIDDSLIQAEQSFKEKKCYYNFLEQINKLNQFALEQGYALVIITARPYEGEGMQYFKLSALDVLNRLDNKDSFLFLYYVGDHTLNIAERYEKAKAMMNNIDKTVNEKLINAFKEEKLVGIGNKSEVLNYLREKFNLNKNSPTILIDDQKPHIEDCEMNNHFGVHVSNPVTTNHFEVTRRIINGEFGCDTKAYYAALNRKECSPAYHFTPIPHDEELPDAVIPADFVKPQARRMSLGAGAFTG